jgi:hypothetical protein
VYEAIGIYNTGFADASKDCGRCGTRRLLVLTRPGPSSPGATRRPRSRKRPGARAPGRVPNQSRQRPRPAGNPARWYAERPARYGPHGSRTLVRGPGPTVARIGVSLWLWGQIYRVPPESGFERITDSSRTSRQVRKRSHQRKSLGFIRSPYQPEP